MRIISISTEGVLDSSTGELSDRLTVEQLLLKHPGGIIVGNNLYSLLARLSCDIRKDDGWTMSINMQRQSLNPMNKDEKRYSGKLYMSRLTYRSRKINIGKDRYRPRAIKWTVLDLGLFMESPPTTLEGITSAGRALLELAERRGIKPRPSPGAFGSALLRASSEWNRTRRPAPRFISEIARDHLPGNFYRVSDKYRKKFGAVEHCYYLDQESSHHKISASIPLPNPHTLHARGFLRAVENEKYPPWMPVSEVIKKGHLGLFCCVVETSTIPSSLEHLYPPWCDKRGKHVRWLWDSELRLLEGDHRIHIQHVCCSLSTTRMDTAICEYAEWCLTQKDRPDKKYIKSTMLAAYGMLATRTDRPFFSFSVHGRPKPPRAEVVRLPLIDRVYRSEVKQVRTPAIQNVIARGCIEAETRTRSIEMARWLEDQKMPVAQIYADGLLVVTDQLPLVLPEHWRVAASLTHVSSPTPNSIVSDQLVRLPGIMGSAKEAYIRNMLAGPVRDSFDERQKVSYAGMDL